MYNETPKHCQQLATLNHLADDLIANRHSNDDTSDLQDMMTDLNKRWEKVTERCVCVCVCTYLTVTILLNF